MEKSKRILVMMSTYNGEKHLKAQIDSILKQKTNHSVHLRIRDDGSEDRTCEIIEEYVRRYPDKVELIRGENIGYNASFFCLFLTARGFDYYSISDQDDVWLEDKLQIACDAIDDEKEDIPILYASTSYLVHDNLVPYGTTRKKEREMSMYNTIIQNICPGHTQVMNNRLIEKINEREIDTSRIYVYDSWIQNMANLYGKILFDNEPHTYYRQYEGNQLGSGAGKIGQLIASHKRTNTNDGLKYRKQIQWFFDNNIESLRQDERLFSELKDFLSRRFLIQRVIYTVKSKLYRQSKFETVAWKIAVITGKF